MALTSSVDIQSTDTNHLHRLQTHGHELVADEPAELGGGNAGPAPFDYVLSGLAACTAITLRMYAQRKQWDIGTLRIRLNLQQAADETITVDRHIYSDAPLSDAQWERLLDISAKTPVTRALQPAFEIRSLRGDGQNQTR